MKLLIVFSPLLLFLFSGYETGLADTLSKDRAIKYFALANENYQEATKLLAGGDHEEAEKKLNDAAQQYETLLVNGFKYGQVYYNLGNTYYRQGKLGKSILNYRRAQRLMPRNADLSANLRLVKNSIEDKELSNEAPLVIQRLFFWFFLLNKNELTLATIILYIVVMILLFFLIMFRHPLIKKMIAGFSAGLLILAVSLGVKIYVEEGIHRGVVVSGNCCVRYGPGNEYEPKFEIHEGTECLIKDEKEGWYKVYVYVDVKEGTGSKTEGKVSKEFRRGWLSKENLEII